MNELYSVLFEDEEGREYRVYVEARESLAYQVECFECGAVFGFADWKPIDSDSMKGTVTCVVDGCECSVMRFVKADQTANRIRRQARYN